MSNSKIKSMICNRVGCDREAAYQIGFRGHAPLEMGHAEVEFQVSLVVCDYHREVSVDDVVGDEAWGQIERVFEHLGKTVPERASLEIMLTRMEGK
jgi:hypothetical protein